MKANQHPALAPSCPDRDQWHDFVNGRLPDDARERLAVHLNTCVSCMGGLESLAQDDSFVAELRSSTSGRPQTDAQAERAAYWANRLGPGFWTGLANAEPGSSDGSRDQSATYLPDKPPLGELGQYELLEKLGSGAMGQVYKARHRLMNRIVALKVIHDRRLSDPGAVHRFRKEIRALAQLDHPHIVRALDADLAGDTLFLVMEYVEGIDLAQWVATRGPLPVAQACAFISQAALGLRHAHERGLVHRDIKPSNLIVTPEGQVKLLDLGLALLGNERLAGPRPLASGFVLGSMDYMAPEQWQDSRAVDIRADIYGLGCTLYHLLAGKPPFSAPAYCTAEEKMHAHANVSPPNLGELRPDLPRPLLDLIERLLAKDPARRYATPAQVQAALAPFVELGTLPTRKEDGQAKLSRRRLVTTLAGSALLLFALFAWRPLSSSSQAPLKFDSEVQLFSDLPDQEPLGVLGVNRVSARLNEGVQLHITLNRPAYALVLALNPDGQVQLCHPKTETSMPDLLSKFDCPDEQVIGLTDGKGMQAFLTLTSPKPLPCYQEWHRQFGGLLHWEHCEGEGVWKADAKGIRRLCAQRGDFRDLPKPPPLIVELCEFLRQSPDIGAFELLAFPVKEKDEG